jgi:hypothetical protein
VLRLRQPLGRYVPQELRGSCSITSFYNDANDWGGVQHGFSASRNRTRERVFGSPESARGESVRNEGMKVFPILLWDDNRDPSAEVNEPVALPHMPS